MNNCSFCGAELLENHSFCDVCGSENNVVVNTKPNREPTNFNSNQNSEFNFGAGSAGYSGQPASVIATRGGVVMFQLVIQLIFFPISLAISIGAFFGGVPELGIIFLLIDLWPLGWIIFWISTMAKAPKNRIEYDGYSRLILHTTRKNSETINLSDIVGIQDRPGSWFVNSSLFRADGAITITTTHKVYDFRFISQSAQVCQELNRILSYYRHNR